MPRGLLNKSCRRSIRANTTDPWCAGTKPAHSHGLGPHEVPPLWFGYHFTLAGKLPENCWTPLRVHGGSNSTKRGWSKDPTPSVRSQIAALGMHNPHHPPVLAEPRDALLRGSGHRGADPARAQGSPRANREPRAHSTDF